MDAVVHGRVAAAGLERALETGGEEHDLFLQAIAAGRLQRLELTSRITLETLHVGNMKQLVEALVCETLRELSIADDQQSRRSAGDWLIKAVGNRKFDKLQRQSSLINAWFITPCCSRLIGLLPVTSKLPVAAVCRWYSACGSCEYMYVCCWVCDEGSQRLSSCCCAAME